MNFIPLLSMGSLIPRKSVFSFMFHEDLTFRKHVNSLVRGETVARQDTNLNFRDEEGTWNTWDALPRRHSNSSRECTNKYPLIGLCSADPQAMNMVDLYWGGSLFFNLYSFFPLGYQIVLMRESKQVGLTRPLSIRHTSGRVVGRIKSVFTTSAL